MTRHLPLLLIAGALSGTLAGCGQTQTFPPPVAHQPIAPTEPPAPAAETPPSAPEPVGDVESPASSADADRLARQAEQHAKAIEDLLNARARQDGHDPSVRVIEPDFTTPNRPTEPAPEVAQAHTSQTSEPQAVPVVVDPPAPVADNAQPNAAVSVAAMTPAEPARTGIIARSPAVDVAQPGETFEQQLARRAREYPRDLTSQLDYQLALFVKGETVPRAADIAQLPTEDREVLTALMDGLFNFRTGVSADSNMLMNRKVRPLIEMSDRLRSRADLSIPNATLCKEVRGYGLYTPIEPLRFEAGVAHKVIVYSEVENFSSQLNEKNLWQTRLQQELVLYTESGLPVWETKESLTDECRNRRRDFYTVKIIQLPANLNMGRYVLKVSVTDEQAQRIAETSIPVAIVAK